MKKSLQVFALALVATLFSLGTAFSQISFDTDVTSGCSPLTVTFTNTSGVNGYFQWYFGDGDSYTGFDTAHTYLNAGSHWAIVYAYDSSWNYLGSSSYTVIDVQGYNNGLWYNVSPSPACPGDNISLNTTWGYDYYVWDYGDGSPIDSNNNYYSNHIYPNTGNYTTSVKVHNSCGQDSTLTFNLVIDNTTTFPNWINLFVNPSPACPGDNIYMNGPWGYPSYVFDYGDGSPMDSSGNYWTNHTYGSVGTYYISLKITNNCGNDTTLMDSVVINNSLGFPNWVALSANPSPACPGDNIGFNAPWGYPSYIYDYGDGSALDTTNSSWMNHIYNSFGTYYASVKVTNNCGNDTTLLDSVVISNVSTFPNWLAMNVSSPACPGDNIGFNAPWGYPSYIFDYGDGSPLDSTGNYYWANHIYNSVGTYYVSVKITSNCGNDTTLLDSVVINNSLGFPNWVNLGVNSSPACPNDNINFNAP